VSSMHGTSLRFLAAGALVAGVAGCSLPHVLPTQAGPTSGPSPYGVWYEQHWATNSVLLAASDNPEVEVQTVDDTADDTAIEETSPEERAEAAQQAIDDLDAAVEASADASEEAAQAAEDFSNSTQYQFPAEAFVPADPATPTTGGPIRY